MKFSVGLGRGTGKTACSGFPALGPGLNWRRVPMISASFAVQRFEDGRFLEERDDQIAVEEPLEIRVEGQSIAVVMRTPGSDRELATGFLVTEGIVKTGGDIFDVSTCVEDADENAGNVIDVTLMHPQRFDAGKFTRHVFTSSSCGICGKATIDAVLGEREALADPVRMDAARIALLPEVLAKEQQGFRRTGGLHACALFDDAGRFVALREDVGRHNALDKLIGWALIENKLPLQGHIVLLSGRASFEMMQKAHAAGIPMVVAIGAPSTLAITFAEASGQTLVGFLRGNDMNVYAHAERISESAGAAPGHDGATRAGET